MLEWRRCGTCRARLAPDAEWCGQCYAPAPAVWEDPLPGGPSDPSPSGGRIRRPPAVELVEVPPSSDLETAPDAFLVLRHEPVIGSHRARVGVTAAVIGLALGTDALFLPHVGYMVAYGAFVSVLSFVVLRRVWRRSQT